MIAILIMSAKLAILGFLKGTAMQIEKALINNHFHVSKNIIKILHSHNFAVIFP